MNLNYADYLKLDRLLELQEPKSTPPEHDEELFIVIHQTYELWFKLVLFEFGKLKRDFSAGDLYGAIHTMKRVRTVMKTLVAQLDILETMTPLSFSGFRDRLETASGFQSHQFRMIEFALGMKRPEALRNFPPGSRARRDLEKALEQRSIVDHFYDFLERRGVPIPAEIRSREATLPHSPDENVQAGLLELYRSQPDLVILFELMTDFDEGLQEWRYRHVKLAERTIGDKTGTGGSTGVEFLKATLFRPVFPDLWAIRRFL